MVKVVIPFTGKKIKIPNAKQCGCTMMKPNARAASKLHRREMSFAFIDV